MSPPGYSNGNGHGHHANPEGAEHAALISAVSRGVAKLEAAERSFNLTAKVLVRDSKETRGDLAEVKGDVDELRGTVLRVEGKLDTLIEVVGRPPEAIDPVEVIRRMQSHSVQGLTRDEVIAREDRIRAELEQRAHGTGLFGLVAEGPHIDQMTMERIQEIAQAKAQEAAKGVVVEAKEAAQTGNRSTLIKGGAAAGVGAALVALIAALGGSDGIVAIIRAFVFGG